LALALGYQRDNLKAVDLPNDVPESEMLLADKAYDSDAIRSLVTSLGG
jgi:hypothetical protein